MPGSTAVWVLLQMDKRSQLHWGGKAAPGTFRGPFGKFTQSPADILQTPVSPLSVVVLLDVQQLGVGKSLPSTFVQVLDATA